MKRIAAIMCVIGFLLVIGAVGADDFYTLELHQMHTLQIWQVITGLLMCTPMVMITGKGL